MSRQGGLRIERMCQLAQVSRAGFYRSWQEAQPVEEEMMVRAEIQQIALAHRRRYGYRRITAELRRRGLLVNHKRVVRLMREDNLLAIQPRAFVVTTDAQHDLEVYLNLARRLTLTGINQLWVADITYIRLRTEFVFLAVVIDRYSRKAIGWALDRSLSAKVAVGALQQAIERRQPLERFFDEVIAVCISETRKDRQQQILEQALPLFRRPADAPNSVHSLPRGATSRWSWSRQRG